MRRHLLTIGVILIGAGGCDNVAFDGVDFAVLPPPERPVTDTPEVVVETDEPVNVDGPVLFAGNRDGPRATLTLVGEVSGDALTPFPDQEFASDVERLAELTAAGSEWVLFSEGVRVGRLFADASGTAGGYCDPRATISGVVELVPSAAAAERFMALPAADVATREYAEYQALQHVYDQRVASLEIAQGAIQENGAAYPREGVLDARKEIKAFDVSGPDGPYVAATFLNEDELEVAPPGQGAYALFVIGRQIGSEYAGAFTWYRPVDTSGKGAPRYFDHLDWNGDGTDEILLEVLGANRMWFAGLARRDGAWVRTFQDECGSGSTTGD